MRIPLGNSILFLTLGFNKVTLRVIFRNFGKGKNDFLRDIILMCIKILIKSVLNKINFNILEIILFSKVVNIYFIIRDKVNSFLITRITK